MHAWEGSPRLESTPEFGSTELGSELTPSKAVGLPPVSWRVASAVAVGLFVTMTFLGGSTVRAAWSEIAQLLNLQGKAEPASPAILSEHEIQRLSLEGPQQQAELLLGRAINHYQGANEQIAARADGWTGALELNADLNSLVTTALKSNDLRVRAAAIEIDLAALRRAKNPESVEGLIPAAESGLQEERVKALWALGLLGNRGVERERVTPFLVSQLRDSNPEVRHGAVEGLAYLGTDDTIAPLLQVLHGDPSPLVRERAACSLAQCGMLNQEQRRTVVPKLLEFVEDSSLDTQTHTWVYQALREITGQSLPDDPDAWRVWHASARAN